MNTASGIRAALLLLIILLAGSSSAAAQSRSLLDLQTADGMPRLVVDTSGTIVARGTFENRGGTRCEPKLPVTGEGARLLWHPCKAAFRFGYLEYNPTAWDDGNIGAFSFAGGQDVIAKGPVSFAFGSNITATGPTSFAVGSGNTASGGAAIALGSGNTCSVNNCVAIGTQATSSQVYAIALGYWATASGRNSLAIGSWVSTNEKIGSIVMGDAWAPSDTRVESQADNEFRARFSGGIRLRVSPRANGNTPGADNNVGCDLTNKVPTWTCASSRTVKENFVPVDGEDILRRLRDVPVTTWTMIGDEDGVLHLGPVAEDFYQAFGLGLGETAIGLGDIDGVNFAAAQALERRTTELREEMERRAAEDQDEARAMRAEIERLRAQVSELQARLAAFEALEKRLARIEAAAGAVTVER